MDPQNKTIFKYSQIDCPSHKDGYFYFYILECSDNSLYCGSSSILSERLTDHQTGKAAQWTRMRLPVQLIYFETYNSQLEAMRRESQVKGWTRKKKENLILGKWKKQ